MSYSLHVKSYEKRTMNILVNQDEDHLVATRGSKYYLVADNKTNHKSTVHITCGNKYVGTWQLQPRSKLKIEETIDDSFVFKSATARGVSNYASDPMSCEVYYISATFEPINTTISIPVHICDHVVS